MDNRLTHLRSGAASPRRPGGTSRGVAPDDHLDREGTFRPSLPLAFKLAATFETTIEAIFTPDR